VLTVLNSATHADAGVAGRVVVAGSHGGAYPACRLAAFGPRGIILNDAGFGFDNAGVASLDYLDDLRIAGAVVDHRSARIGDGADMYRRGRISAVNSAAAVLGCAVDQSCAEAASRMAGAALSSCRVPAIQETRHILRGGDTPVIGLDSVSLVREDDVGAIIVSGSHGGLIGPARSAVKVDVLAAVFHDAGIGCDDAGISRLPALDALGIAAATVDGATARIGDARSIWATGRLSAVNVLANTFGAEVGLDVPGFADVLIRARTTYNRRDIAG